MEAGKGQPGISISYLLLQLAEDKRSNKHGDPVGRGGATVGRGGATMGRGGGTPQLAAYQVDRGTGLNTSGTS